MTGSCGSCFFAKTDSGGTMRCCCHAPSWQRVSGFAGGTTVPMLPNFPVVTASDWCGEGADASSGAPFAPPPAAVPAFTTVAKLPSPTPALAGLRTFITDAVTGHSVGSPLTGGGTLTMPVYCTGQQWLAG